MNRRLLFIDGNSLAARSFHAMSELATSKNEHTGAIYGFLKGMSWCRYQTKIPLFQCVVFWDGGHAEYRKRIYKQYKQGRKLNEDKAQREDYHRQLDAIRELLSHSGCKQIFVRGCEADDLISVFIGFLRKQGDSSIIYSGDGDFHQLYGCGVDIFDPKKELLGIPDLRAKWKVPVDKILLKKVLVGDASDNIKGVAQVGTKRATMCCTYLRLSKSWKLEVEKNGWSEKEAKWIEIALESKKIVKRNIELMRLPSTWEQSFYDDEQAVEAMTQWLEKPKKNRRKFMELLDRHELDLILENLSNW